MADLSTLLDRAVRRHRVPGAAIGVLHHGTTESSFAGVTSVVDRLAVDERTLFQVGSITKTFTASAVVVLVDRGFLTLDDPVREHVPELRLADGAVAEQVTVRQLLNHTAGWDGTFTSGEDEPDADLERFVATALPALRQLGLPGRRAEYNNAAVALAGRLVEKLTGTSYEQAVRTLLLEPLGLTRTYFTTEDVMTERVVVGHVDDGDGYRVARPWRWPRAGTRRAAWSRRSPTSWPGRASRSTTVLPRTAPGSSARRSSRRCVGRPPTWWATRWATPSASAGSCATSAACRRSGTRAPPTVSSPSCAWCRITGSPSWRSPTAGPRGRP